MQRDSLSNKQRETRETQKGKKRQRVKGTTKIVERDINRDTQREEKDTK